MKLPGLASLVVLSGLLPFFCHAEIYQWVDEQGRVHYSDQKPEHAHLEVEPPPISIYRMETPDIEDDSVARQARNEARLAEKKNQRIRNEYRSAAAEKKASRCEAARSGYRNAQANLPRNGRVEDLRRYRASLDKLNDKIKKFCY